MVRCGGNDVISKWLDYGGLLAFGNLESLAFIVVNGSMDSFNYVIINAIYSPIICTCMAEQLLLELGDCINYCSSFSCIFLCEWLLYIFRFFAHIFFLCRSFPRQVSLGFLGESQVASAKQGNKRRRGC